MSSPRTPSLRKSKRDSKTGKIHHRCTNSHLPIPTQPQTESPKDESSQKKQTSRQSKTPQSSKMPAAETQTDNQVRDEELHRKLDGLLTRFDKVEKTSEDFKTSLEYTQEEVEELKEENAALKGSLQELSLEIQRNTYAIQKITTKHENLETATRKKNLIFEGVPEQQGGRENLHETVYNIMAELGIEKPIEYDATYRIGARPGRFPRPIFISFLRQDDRNMVYGSRIHLRNSQHLSKVWIAEDVTPRTRRARNIIREVAKEARNQGARCMATPNSVTINEKRFTEENLDELPPECTVDKIKMKKLGNTIAYGSEHAPFSNLYPAKVPMNKRNYLSSEQAFRHTRATENKHHNVAARILWTRDPYDLMDLDKDMAVTQEWKQKEDFVLFKCMFRKFEANEDLREILLTTGDMELAEATRSTKWATGASLNSNAMKMHTWTGENRQGKHSMKIREYFRMSGDEYAIGKEVNQVSDSFLEHLYKQD